MAIANSEYLRRPTQIRRTLVSHVGDSRSFVISGAELMGVHDLVTEQSQSPAFNAFSPAYLGWSVVKSGAGDDFSFWVQVKMTAQAPDSAFTNIGNIYNQASPSTITPNTLAGPPGNFHEGDELHVLLMRDAFYRFALSTPAEAAPGNERVVLTFYLGI